MVHESGTIAPFGNLCINENSGGGLECVKLVENLRPRVSGSLGSRVPGFSSLHHKTQRETKMEIQIDRGRQRATERAGREGERKAKRGMEKVKGREGQGEETKSMEQSKKKKETSCTLTPINRIRNYESKIQ